MWKLTSDRFWAKVQRGDGCCEWLGAKNRLGYGEFSVSHHIFGSHRVAYELTRGDIPIGQDVLHRCDNRGCVRPDHLYVGSHSDNMQDKVAAGHDHNAVKTHCPAGHPYDTENTYHHPRGSRMCRTCNREAAIRKRRLTREQIV